MPLIRLLHLSDLHISIKNKFYYNEKYCIACLEEIARISYKNRNNLDGIIISGDISNTGASGDLLLAKEFLFCRSEEPHNPPWMISTKKPSLCPTEKPIVFLPGNHDRFNVPLFNPGSIEFNRIFSQFWQGNSYGITCNLLPNNENPQLAIISADFSLESWFDCLPLFYFGLGKVYPDKLSNLVHVTNQTKKKHLIPIVWAIHFAPDVLTHAEDPVPTTLKLIDSDSFIERAELNEIRYILCGHLHRNIRPYDGDWQKKVKIFSAGSCACKSSKQMPMLYFLEIEIINNDINEIRISPYEWDGGTFVEKPFKPVPP